MRTERLVAVAVVALLAASVNGATTVNYGWEDGVGTILGSYGNLVDDTNVTGPQTGLAGDAGPYTCPGAHGGQRYLHVAEEPHDGTPQAYVAYIENLAAGDEVTASFWGYDDTPGASPSLRIWGHYALNGDVMSYTGSAGGNNAYTDGLGWGQVSHDWIIDPGQEALVIEVRLYSTPVTSTHRTDYWIDDLTVTAPDTASITVAPEPASLALLALGALAVMRRKR